MTADIQKLPRHFVPEDFNISDWETLEPYFKELVERPINSGEDLRKMVEGYE